MRTKCPVCGGLGTVNKSFGDGMVMGYCGPNGERWPQEICQNCGGAQWVGSPDNADPVSDIIIRSGGKP